MLNELKTHINVSSKFNDNESYFSVAKHGIMDPTFDDNSVIYTQSDTDLNTPNNLPTKYDPSSNEEKVDNKDNSYTGVYSDSQQNPKIRGKLFRYKSKDKWSNSQVNLTKHEMLQQLETLKNNLD